jgi:enterobactin synthetase component F
VIGTMALRTAPAADGALALTQAQLGVLFGQQLAGDDSVFHAAEYTVIEGAFEVEAFKFALQTTLQEASALHLRIVERDGVYQQHLLAPPPLALPTLDVEDQSDEVFAATLRVDAARPFDAETGNLFEHRLYRRGAHHHVWLHRAHHLLLDGYGFQLVARRVATHYAARLGGHTAAPARFGELAAVVSADAAYQASAARDVDRRFWLTRLAGLQPVSLCPAPTPGIGRGRRIAGELPATTVSALQHCAVALDLSWPELVIAAYAGYLARHGHGRDVVLGLPVMQRLGGAVARAPCTAMNVMPLPVAEAATQSLAGLARALRVEMPQLRAHQRYRFEHLEGDLEEAGYPPGLLGTEINVMPFESPARFGACRAHTRTLAAGPVEDLAAIFTARGDAIDFDLDGRPQNYDDTTLRAHHQRISDFLTTALQQPERSLAEM